MDDLLIQTRESLTKYESSHPNLTNLWLLIYGSQLH